MSTSKPSAKVFTSLHNTRKLEQAAAAAIGGCRARRGRDILAAARFSEVAKQWHFVQSDGLKPNLARGFDGYLSRAVA